MRLIGSPKDATADENVKAVHTLVICDRRRDLRKIASEMAIRFEVVQSILTDILGMSKVLARWVPRTLTDDQRRTRLYIFLGISCPAMMIQAILSCELLPKMRHGFTTLTQSQICRANNRRTLPYPF